MNNFSSNILAAIYLGIAFLCFYACRRIYKTKLPFFKKGIASTKLEHSEILAQVQFILAAVLGLAASIFALVAFSVVK